jgi:hypothetical protein
MNFPKFTAKMHNFAQSGKKEGMKSTFACEGFLL